MKSVLVQILQSVAMGTVIPGLLFTAVRNQRITLYLQLLVQAAPLLL